MGTGCGRPGTKHLSPRYLERKVPCSALVCEHHTINDEQEWPGPYQARPMNAALGGKEDF